MEDHRGLEILEGLIDPVERGGLKAEGDAMEVVGSLVWHQKLLQIANGPWSVGRLKGGESRRCWVASVEKR